MILLTVWIYVIKSFICSNTIVLLQFFSFKTRRKIITNMYKKDKKHIGKCSIFISSKSHVNTVAHTFLLKCFSIIVTSNITITKMETMQKLNWFKLVEVKCSPSSTGILCGVTNPKTLQHWSECYVLFVFWYEVIACAVVSR